MNSDKREKILKYVKVYNNKTSTNVYSFNNLNYFPVLYQEIDLFKITIKDIDENIPFYLKGNFSCTLIIRPRQSS